VVAVRVEVNSVGGQMEKPRRRWKAVSRGQERVKPDREAEGVQKR